MGASGKLPYPYAGYVGRKGVRTFAHRMLIGASGAITAQDNDSGVVATKQGTAGQYLLQFPSAYKRICDLDTTFIGPLGANTTGFAVSYNSNNLETVPIPGQSVGTKAGNILMNLSQTSNANADVPAGTVLIVHADLELGV